MSETGSNFIFNEIDKDIENGIYDKDSIVTRFRRNRTATYISDTQKRSTSISLSNSATTVKRICVSMIRTPSKKTLSSPKASSVISRGSGINGTTFFTRPIIFR